MVKILLFDWGDTVMRVIPGLEGPMSEWPIVEAVPNILESLSQIKESYWIGIATNAQDSGPAGVRDALKRVNLDKFFSFIYTPHELGAFKTDPWFFPSILKKLNEQKPDRLISPAEVVMIGDNYWNDILTAKKAGLKAIWYNPEQTESPSLPPWQDGDIADMNFLPETLHHLDLPDPSLCLAWQLEHGLPSNIIAHTETVAAAAYLMAIWLKQAGLPINPILAHRGGLLHDLDKLSCRKQGMPHGDYAFEQLIRKGQTELAEIAKRHVISNILNPESAPRTWEEKLVYFADKLTEGSQIGFLSIRLDGLISRYPEFADSTLACQSKIEALQTELCAILDLTPQELISQLNSTRVKPHQH